MWKKIIAIIVFLIIAIGVPVYLLVKDDPAVQHYNPYDDGPTDLAIFTEALEGTDGRALFAQGPICPPERAMIPPDIGA